MNVPWRLANVVALYVATVAGGALLVLSWYGASGTARLGTGIAWANVGALGLVVAGTGNVVWLLYGHRAVRARQRALIERAAPLQDEPPTIDLTATLVAVPGGQRAHRPTCPLVRGKATIAAADHVPCEACRP